MKTEAILIIILIAGFVISFVSFIIWALCKNEKIAKLFRKISDWFGKYWRW